MNTGLMILAMIAHIVCGVTDCLLSYTPKGRLDLKQIKDPKKMREMFADMPLSFPLASMIAGTFAILAFGFGYLDIARYVREFSPRASVVLYISAMVFLIPIVTHHVFCGAVEWLYIRLGRTDEAREAVLEMQKKTMITMFAGYLGLLVFLITLFVTVVTGNCGLPRWACVFNTLVFLIAMLPTKIPAKGNAAGALMYAGLLAVTLI